MAPCSGVDSKAPVIGTGRDRAEEVYRRDGDRLWRSLLGFSGDREIADDAVAEAFAQLLQRGEGMAIGPLLDANFDLRRSLCRIHPDNISMIEGARSVGASAKFTGSGGAIVGLYDDEKMFISLKRALSSQGVSVLKPNIV